MSGDAIAQLLKGLPAPGPIQDEGDEFETGPLRDRMEELIAKRQQKIRDLIVGAFDWDGMTPSDDPRDIAQMIAAEAEAVYGAAANMTEFFIMAMAIGAEVDRVALGLATLGVSGEESWRISASGGAKRIAAGFANSRKRFDEQAAIVVARLEAEDA